MTPTQLRAFTAVVRLGSIKAAAEELEVSESAVSFNIAQLRKELGDQLVSRHASGLVFTPGGLRLATRAAELLGLQDRTVLEVSQAASGRRLLRLASSSMFGEYAAPGLIDLFARRAADLDVELSLQRPDRFAGLLRTRAVDVVVGPIQGEPPSDITAAPFLNYQLVPAVAPTHELAGKRASAAALRHQVWNVGPAAATGSGLVAKALSELEVPEDRQRIFQSHTAATDETKSGPGITLAPSFVIGKDVARGALATVETTDLALRGSWALFRLDSRRHDPLIDELARFVTTPRAIQAMIRGAGVPVGRFRPSIHVTLWS